jgi:hypothetical protein
LDFSGISIWFQVLIAIAIPLHLAKGRNVFVSYNFEGNYNEPIYAYETVPGPLVRVSFPGF